MFNAQANEALIETVNNIDYKVNCDYEYEDQDITAILNARLRQYNNSVNNTPVYSTAAVDTISYNQLVQRLQQEKDSHPNGKRIVLIPCNIGNYHWVGLLLEFNDNNACSRAEFINSTSLNIPQTLQRQLQAVYNKEFVDQYDVIMQSDGTSCGACTIENLILRMTNSSVPIGIRMSQLRAKHLNILNNDADNFFVSEYERIIRRRFYESFNNRQCMNQRTFDSKQFDSFKDSGSMSELEILSIARIASLILNASVNVKKGILAAFRDCLDDSKEPKIVLDKIRKVLWDFSKDSKAQELSALIFGLKKDISIDTEAKYFKESTLQFEYEYLKNIYNLSYSGEEELKKIKLRIEARQKLLENLKDPYDVIRQKAAEKLRKSYKFLKEEELCLLRDLAKYDTFQTVRIAAAEALYIKGFDSDRSEAYKIIIELLAYPGLDNPNHDHDGAEIVRACAAKALGILNSDEPEIIKALNHAAQSSFQNVKIAAENALRQSKQSFNVQVNNVSAFNESSSMPRQEFFKQAIAQYTKALMSEFKENNPNVFVIRKNFYFISWRVNELSWKYKYELKNKGLITEEIWHLFDFICVYLSANPNTDDLTKWQDIAEECNSLVQILSGTLLKPLNTPCLIKKIRPAFAASQLAIINQQITHFYNNNSFNAFERIHCYALLNLIMVIGESTKRLAGLDPELPKFIIDALSLIKDIRDLLEKKLPSNLFSAHELMINIYGSIDCLGKAIANFVNSMTENNKMDLDSFKLLLNLLEEKSAYTCLEQAKIFFAGLIGNQKSWLEWLQNGDYQSFLNNRFGINYEELKNATEQKTVSSKLNLSEIDKSELVSLINEEVTNSRLSQVLLKLIDNPKTLSKGLITFLDKNKIQIKKLRDICETASKGTDDYLLSKLASNSNLTKDQLENLQSFFNKLNERTSNQDFGSVLFMKIKQLPWLLNLAPSQVQFLKVLDHTEEVSNKDALDSLLKLNNLEGNKINKLFDPGNLTYTPKPYYKKFSYPENKINQISSLVSMINNLVELLVDIKKIKSTETFTKLLNSDTLYQLALQLAIKAFGVIIKDKLDKEIKKRLLENNSRILSAKHIQLLELFRDQLAHRAIEVDVYELMRFALHWAVFSYPALKQQISSLLIATPLSIAKNRTEIIITENMLIDQALLIQGLAKTYGFTRVRSFGNSTDCQVGIQSELNLIVDSLLGTTELEVYEFQWQLHFMLDWNVKIFTEQSLFKNINKTISADHLNDILRQTVDLNHLVHLAHIKKLIDKGNYYELIISNATKPIRKKDIEPATLNLKDIKGIIVASGAEDYILQRLHLEKLLQNESIKDIIKKKAEDFSKELQTQFTQLNASLKTLVLECLQAITKLNNQLDLFYEKHVKEILAFNLQISRLEFRRIMYTDHQELPLNFRDNALAKRAKEEYEREGFIIEKIHKNGCWEAVNLYSRLKFFLDETHNPNIPKFLGENRQFQQLVKCVYRDFCERFIDPFEQETKIKFSCRERVETQPSFYIAYDREIEFERIPFSEEVLEKLSANDLPVPIVNSSIDIKVRSSVLNIKHGYKPLPEDIKMTTDNLFKLANNYKYGGKIQKLSCIAFTFDYLQIKNFDDFFRVEKIRKENYPNYAQDKILFNEYQQFKAHIDDLFYCEKQIITQHQYLVELNAASLSHSSDSNAYWLNQEYAKDIDGKIVLLRNLQQFHIKQALACSYIANHPDIRKDDFMEIFIQELINWIYYDKNDDTNKLKLREFLLNYLDKLLFEAAFQGKIDTVTLLLKQGANVNSRHTDPRNSYAGKTPLFIAAEMGHDNMVEILLEKGADHSIEDNGGWTPCLVANSMLTMFPEQRHNKCIELLKAKSIINNSNAKCN